MLEYLHRFSFRPLRLFIPLCTGMIAVALLFTFALPIRIFAAPLADACNAQVDSSGTEFSSADATAVQDAIDAAVSGDIVKIAGSCMGVTTVGTRDQTAHIEQSLTLQGGYDASGMSIDWTATPDSNSFPTILDADNAGRVVYIDDGLIVNLFDLTLTQGSVTGIEGGGIFIDESTVTISNTMIVANTAMDDTGAGGGIYMRDGSLMLVDSSVSGNYAYDEGAGAYILRGTLIVNNAGILSNTSDFDGGGLYLDNVTTHISNTTFISNVATYAAGGIFVEGGTASITNTQFISNSADAVSDFDAPGGGILNGGGTVSVYASHFEANSTGINANSECDNDGGGVANYGVMTIDDTTFVDNYACDDGGGLESDTTETLDITNSAFYNNVALDEGGGLRTDTGRATLINTTIYSNTADHGAGMRIYDVAHIYNSTIMSNTSTDDGGGIAAFEATVLISNTRIVSNTAADDGGGVETTGGTTTIMGNSVLERNVTTDTGGGFRSVVSGTVYISDTIFLSNTARLGAGALLDDVTATLKTVTFEAGSAEAGGGISIFTTYRDSNVWLNDVKIHNNEATVDGGGILSANCGCDTSLYVTMTHSIVYSNTATDYGGAILSEDSTVSVINSTLYGNSAALGGSAIYAENSETNILSSTLHTHSTNGGGTIYLGAYEGPSSMHIVASSLISNSAQSDGGAIFSENESGTQTVEILNSTIAGNAAGGEGGAIWDEGGTFTLTHVTIISNSATTGQALFASTDSTVVMRNSVIASAGTDTCVNSGGTLTSGGGNLASDASCNLVGTGDIPSTDPLLESLADNGGPTLTHKPIGGLGRATGSPTIDNGLGINCAALDQRGTARLVSSNCDIGAYEAALDPTAIELVSFTATPQLDGSVTLEWETATEANHAGYLIYRWNSAETRTERTQVTTVLIASRGINGQGETYSYDDTTVAAGDWVYLLVDVDLDGVETEHPTTNATISVPTAVGLQSQGVTTQSQLVFGFAFLVLIFLTSKMLNRKSEVSS